MQTSTLSKLLLSLTAAVTIASVASAKIIRDQNETIDLEGIKSIEVQISAGNIDVVGSDRSNLQFDLEKIFKTDSESEADEMEKRIERSVTRRGDRLIIEIKRENNDSFWKSIFSDSNGVNFNAALAMPSNLEVKLHTNGGNVKVYKIVSKIDAQTNGGNIRIEDSRGEVNAHTNGGNIDVSDAQGVAKLHTNGGNIKVVAHDASISAHTNGGNIDAYFHGGITDDSSLETNGGRVTAHVPEDAEFQLSAKSQGGNVKLNHNGSIKGDIRRNEVKAAVNGGGPLLRLGTHGGQVVIENL